MAFGGTNSPATLQRLVETLFPASWPVHAYLDDIIFTTKTFEEHVYWLRKVLRTLADAGLVVNREKSSFCVPEVVYLGYILDVHGLRPNPKRIEPVLKYPVPKNVKEIRRFLGMVGWYARFIEKAAELKTPLCKLLRNDQKYEWREDQQQAFEKLKNALITASVLARPDFTQPFTIQTDASDVSIGAVLTQEDENGEEHPITYISRALNADEKGYTVTEKEWLAIIWAIEYFRPYVEGPHFKVITDRPSLQWLMKLKGPTGRLYRWALKLQAWDFEIIHRKGASHLVPDALSRIDHDEVSCMEEIEDQWYIRRFKDIQKDPERWPDWQTERGLIYVHKEEPLLHPVTENEYNWKLVVPKDWQHRVLEENHNET